MIRHLSVILVVFLALFMCVSQVGAEDALSRAETLEAKGGMDNLKEAVRFYKQAAEKKPQNYEARWKGARACRKISKQAKLEELEGWKDICAEYGKQGMKLAAEAVDLRPEGVEGNFYYGVCVGSYSDGVSIFTALS
jgi:TPR repeat protein